jgi:hypothetical protein
MQTELGLPKMGVDGKRGGLIDVCEWLTKFAMKNLNVEKMEQVIMNSESLPSSSPPSSSSSFPRSKSLLLQRQASLHGLDSLQFLLDALHTHSLLLESLFRYLDVDGDGCVSVDEFKDGVSALSNIMTRPLLDRETERIIKMLDADGDGRISYTEFLNGFSSCDESMAQRQRSAFLQQQQYEHTSVSTASVEPDAIVVETTDDDEKSLKKTKSEAGTKRVRKGKSTRSV